MSPNPIFSSGRIPEKIVLASKSPRRQELLKGLDIDFSIRTKEIDESFPEELDPPEIAGYLARKKAAEYKKDAKPNELIITADTVVLAAGLVLNKPNSAEEAEKMLQLLSGKHHRVVTAVALLDLTKQVFVEDSATVHFRHLAQDEINYYIEKYRPFDKAGSYGIQEWIGYIGIERIEGSFYTVMGLPVHLVYRELAAW